MRRGIVEEIDEEKERDILFRKIDAKTEKKRKREHIRKNSDKGTLIHF